MEGTGTDGAGLTRFLLDHGVQVLEADRPDRTTRRRRGKSDPIDAEAAARAVLAGTATALPKRHDGIVEAIRVLRGVRAGAVKARTAAINQPEGRGGHRSGRRPRGAGHTVDHPAGGGLRSAAAHRYPA